MARMSIDDKFLRDGRVKLLGQRLGWSRRETMGALLDVFAVAYDQEDDIIPLAEIDAAADKQGFALMMAEVNLGEIDGHDMRIKGAGERIEYLAKKREAGAKGGRKSGESRRKRHEAKRSSASEAREASWNPPDPVPDLPPDPVPEDQKLSLPRDPAVPPAVPVPHHQNVPPDLPTSRAIPPPAPITPEAKALHDGRRALFWRCWQLAGEAFARVQASGIDAHAPNGWAGTPDSTSPPAQNLLAIIAGMLVGERPDFAAAEAKIANRIAVAEAEARAMSPPSARYMTPARIWNRDSFAIAVDMTPEQAATPVIRASRAGPKSSAARANSDPKIGRIEPPPASAFRGGIQKL